MEYTVIGYKRSSGEYQGYKFDNLLISTIRPAAEDNPNECGEIAEIFKVKSSAVHGSLELGSTIRVLYNRFGKVESVEIY